MQTPHDHRVFTIDPADPLVESRIQEALAACNLIAVTWSVADVKGLRPDLTDDQCWDVLEQARDKHDADWGITYETLRTIAQDLFDPDADEAEEA